MNSQQFMLDEYNKTIAIMRIFNTQRLLLYILFIKFYNQIYTYHTQKLLLYELNTLIHIIQLIETFT